MPHVKVTIDKLGRVKSDPQGYSGPECKEATKPITTAFRGANIEDNERPEMHETRIETDTNLGQQISL